MRATGFSLIDAAWHRQPPSNRDATFWSPDDWQTRPGRIGCFVEEALEGSWADAMPSRAKTDPSAKSPRVDATDDILVNGNRRGCPAKPAPRHPRLSGRGVSFLPNPRIGLKKRCMIKRFPTRAGVGTTCSVGAIIPLRDYHLPAAVEDVQLSGQCPWLLASAHQDRYRECPSLTHRFEGVDTRVIERV